MTKIFTLRTALLGFLTWFIPLAVSFAFIDRNGQFLIPQPLFKSLMVVVGGGVGVWMLVLVFRRIAPSFQSGLWLGLFWLALNLGLDLAVLVPMVKMTVPGWFQDIGLRYLLLPMVSVGMGVVGAKGVSQ